MTAFNPPNIGLHGKRKKLNQLAAWVDDDLYAKIITAADERGLSRSKFVTLALIYALDNMEETNA